MLLDNRGLPPLKQPVTLMCIDQQKWRALIFRKAGISVKENGICLKDHCYYEGEKSQGLLTHSPLPLPPPLATWATAQ